MLWRGSQHRAAPRDTMQAAPSAHNRDPLSIDLALQGGGAHGAFTWGVLDRLLEEPWLHIAGISGTSAGAMNAAVLVHGHSVSGHLGARSALEDFWRRVSDAGRFSPVQRGPIDVLLGRWTLYMPLAGLSLDFIPRLFSPSDPPLGKGTPLKNFLAKFIDFERAPQPPINFFIPATNVATGRARVFRNREITGEVLIAS